MIDFNRRAIATPLCGALLAVACWISAVRADEASDYLKAAGDEADALTDCTVAYVRPLVKSSKSPDTIAQEALVACGDKLGALRIALMGAPTNLSAEKAASEAQKVRDSYRAQLVDLILKARKEN